MVQWLRLGAPHAGGMGSIPGQGTRSHMLQLRVRMLQRRLKILCATAKTSHGQINKQIYIFKDTPGDITGVSNTTPKHWLEVQQYLHVMCAGDNSKNISDSFYIRAPC